MAAGTRVCHQRRHSRFPGDTGADRRISDSGVANLEPSEPLEVFENFLKR